MKRNIGWQSILRSAECREVLAQVAALGKKGERVYPIQKDVFRDESCRGRPNITLLSPGAERLELGKREG
jgi:hypothetical protein